MLKLKNIEYTKLTLLNMMKLRSWIDESKLYYPDLSMNPNSISFLEANTDKINWAFLSRNPNAIPMLKSNLKK